MFRALSSAETEKHATELAADGFTIIPELMDIPEVRERIWSGQPPKRR